MDYATWRTVHMSAAAVSVALFVVRAARAVARPQAPLPRPLRILPHAVDTLLLGSALVLAWQLGLAGTRGWLPAKVGAVIVYILLGMVALHRGRTRAVRASAFVAALLVVVYIVSVAVTKSPYVGLLDA